MREVDDRVLGRGGRYVGDEGDEPPAAPAAAPVSTAAAGKAGLSDLTREQRLSLILRQRRQAAEKGKEAPPPIPRAPREGDLPLSFAQQRLWFLDQLEPGNPAYNIPAAVRASGALDVAAFARAVTEMVRRHEVLRTTFPNAGGEPRQVIAPPPARLPLPVIDLSGLPAARRDPAARELKVAAARQPFDLGRDTLARILLLRLAAEVHVALVNLHHIAADGWSVSIVIREIAGAYAACAAGRAPELPELPIQYADFAVWQRGFLAGPELERQLAFWRQALAGAPPVLELPADRPRPPFQTFRGGQRKVDLPPELWSEVRAASRRGSATPFMIALASFKALLARLTGQADVVVGSPIANRNRREIDGLIGFFVNTLVLRTDLSGGPGFDEAVGRVREGTLAAYAHQDLPFEEVVKELGGRDLSRNPLFQVMFSLTNVPQSKLEMEGLALALEDSFGDTAKFDFHLTTMEQGGTLTGSVEYSADLFDPTTVDRIVAHWQRLLAAALAEPARPLAELPLLGPGERQQLLREWSDAAPVAGGITPVHELFAAEAARRPDAAALVAGPQILTYGELAQRSSRMARRLAELGVGPGMLVGLCAERSPELILGVLAILAAGGAYLPLDPAHPMDRLAYTLADAGAPVLLAEEALFERLPADAARVVGLHALIGLAGGQEAADEAPPAAARAVRAEPGTLAYVIYTSGSTGKPKGVEVSHANVARLFAVIRQAFPFGQDDVWTLFHSIAFDFSVWELWGALAFGGRLVVVPSETARSTEAFYDLLRGEGVTVLSQTPSAFRQLLWAEESALERADAMDARVSDLRLVVFGGEALDPLSLAPWLERHGEERPLLVNMYGITETTVHTTWRRLRQSDLARPGSVMGRPLSDLSLYLLDGGGRPVPIGVAGEIHVGGAGVARGYLARPALTAERFVPDPFAGEGGQRLYRSGDLARWRRDGDLEYLGRIDRQVKVRGFRIELGEIEAALAEHPGVREAVVVAREDRPGDVRLVGYVSSAAKPDPTSQALAAFLAERLPGYMVPAAWVVLDRLPLTANGKVDRAALPAPEERGEGVAYVAPRSPVEQVLAGIWEEVLEQPRVGVEDDFFALGGHSLVAAQVTSRVLKAFAVELPLRVLFERPTVAALAVEVERLRGSGTTVGAPPLVRAPRGSEAPLSFSQERIWLFDQLSPGNSAYPVPLALTLGGAVSAPALAAALAALVERHETLRTSFVSVGGKPVQRIDPSWRPPLPFVDLGGLPPAAAEREAERLVVEERTFPFDLARGPLIRSVLLRQEEEVFVLLLTLHHIIADGWTMRVLARELTALYGAAQAGLPSPLPELPIQFRDFAIWQRAWLEGEVLESLISAAVARLAGMPRLDLPVDRPREARRYFTSGLLQLDLDAALTARLRALSRRQGASLFMTLLAAFTGLLCRHTGQGDFAVATIIAGRTRAELEPLVGYFTNHLLIRAAAAGDPDFGELLARTRRATLAAYDQQDLPFSHLAEALRAERPGEAPLAEVSFIAQPPRSEVAAPGAAVAQFPVDATLGHTNFALAIDLIEAGGDLDVSLSYNQTLFDATTARRWRGHLEALLAGAAADPARPLAELPLLSEGERHQVTVEWEGAVRLDGGPAPIGIWGEMAGAPAGRRVRHLADGTLEASAPAPAGPAEPPAAPAPAAAAPAAPARPGEPARSLESLSSAKRKLLAKRIRGEAGAGAAPTDARREPKLLVDLQPERPAAAAQRPPFFCVHAIGGAVLSYRELALRLGEEQPFYGIQAAGLAGGSAVDDLPAMAAQYAAAVEAVAPHGPYLLGGWSFGGIVAFEMARQMRQRGRPVALVALIDSWAPALVPMPVAAGEDDLVRLYLRDQAGLAGLDASWLDGEPPGMDEAAALDWLLARAHETGLLRASLRLAQVKPLLDVYGANVHANATYRPRPGGGRLTLFRPRTSSQPTNGWSALSGEPVEVHEMAADHYSMLVPPAVVDLADRLRSCIERALAAAPRAAGGPPAALVPQASEARS